MVSWSRRSLRNTNSSLTVHKRRSGNWFRFFAYGSTRGSATELCGWFSREPASDKGRQRLWFYETYVYIPLFVWDWIFGQCNSDRVLFGVRRGGRTGLSMQQNNYCRGYHSFLRFTRHEVLHGIYCGFELPEIVLILGLSSSQQLGWELRLTWNSTMII